MCRCGDRPPLWDVAQATPVHSEAFAVAAILGALAVLLIVVQTIYLRSRGGPR